jgi:DNA-binding response OmpR family regulator
LIGDKEFSVPFFADTCYNHEKFFGSERQMMRILLAEDDSRLGKLIEYMLVQNKFNVEWITNGGDIFEYAMYSEYDILILDWMMPNVSGIEACRQLREAGYERAIIMLTARDTVEDRVMGLDAGADDYLVKPFEFDELLARLRALGRRSTQKIQQEIIEIGDFTLNRTTKVLMRKEQIIQLSPREFQIFDLLAQNLGVVVPRDIILDRIWGLERDITSNNIDSYMKILRKKLMDVDGNIAIKTVRGIGYRLEA